MVKNLPAVRETWVASLGWEDPPGEGNGNPLQYFCLENPMDRGAWWAILTCEVKWALGSITRNKASGGDGIPVELFQSLKDDAVKALPPPCIVRKDPRVPHTARRGA